MKDKKGILFGIIPAVFGFIALTIIILLIVFSGRILAVLMAIFDFFAVWWWAILIAIALILFKEQFRAILNTLLGRLGVKV